MEKNINYNLLARYVAGECSSREEAIIESWIEDDPDFNSCVEDVQKIWDTKMQQVQSWNVDANWASLNKEIIKEAENQLYKDFTGNRKNKKRSRNSSLAWGLRIAAIFMLVGTFSLSGVIYFSGIFGEQSTVLKEVTTERGERANVQLNDGSVVNLASESQLIYALEFGEDKRSVHLSGAAYFEVASDDGRPFNVFADEVVVQVLGTSFGVKSYQDEDIQVVVTSGEVKVGYDGLASDLSDGVLLGKGDLVHFQRAVQELSVTQNVELNHHLGWLINRMVFDDTTLTEVSRKLERWYGVDITLSDPGLEKLRLSATFEGDSIHEVLRVIQLALEVNYKIKDNQITFFLDASRDINRN